MYRVECINGNAVIILHENDQNSMRRLASCTFTEGVNNVGSCDFSLYAPHPAYDELHEMTTLIRITNTKTNAVEFEGRIAHISDCGMDSGGVVGKKCHCEGLLAYLYDTMQMYQNYENSTPTEFLNALKNHHNAQVSVEKQISSVYCEVVGTTYSKTTAYRSTLDEIKENLISRLGGEIALRRDGNGDLVLYYFNDGGDGSAQTTKVELARNMVSLKQDVDATEIITRLIPLGAQINDETAERLTLSTDTYPTPWIDDTTAMAKYGVIVGTVEFDDITVESNLLTAGQAALANNNAVKYSYQAEVLDLSTIDLDEHPFRAGNSYEFVNRMMGFDEILRLQSRTVDIYEPYKPRITIGEKAKTITSAISKASHFVNVELPVFRSEILSSAKSSAKALLLDETQSGHVVIEYGQDGTSWEALNICNAQTIDLSTKRWLFSLGGIGYVYRSSVSDDWESPLVAMTMDGAIVADMITTGTLKGIEIQAGERQVDGQTLPIFWLKDTGQLIVETVSGYYDCMTFRYNGVDSVTGNTYNGYTKVQPWRFEVGETYSENNSIVITFKGIYGYYGASLQANSFTIDAETGTLIVYGNHTAGGGADDNRVQLSNTGVTGYYGVDSGQWAFNLESEAGNGYFKGIVSADNLYYKVDGATYSIRTLHNAVFNS